MCFLLALAACSLLDAPSALDEPTAVSDERPRPASPTAIPLARRTDTLDALKLPGSSRPEGKPAPLRFGLVAPFEYEGSADGVEVYRTPLPLHSNLMPTKLQGTHVFGSAPPPGLTVYDPEGRPMGFARKGRAPKHYGFDRDWLLVGVSPGEPAPDWQAITLVFEKATDFEDGLNRDTADQSDAEFLSRTLTLDAESTSGLYLPAPGVAAWTLTVPEDGVFTTRATLLPPAIRTLQRTDGATLHAELLDGGTVLAATEVDLELEEWAPLRWNVGAHGGEELTFRLRTEPGASAVYDYVFLEEPTLYTPSPDPKRTVLVFVDTLRSDHVGVYGYPRDTTPFIDRWAEHGAVFEQARSVAPWTLPSARSALTGYQPEQWFEVDNVAERFGDAGWATEAIVANAFLSQPFDFHRGWSRFRYEHLMRADEVSDAALAAMARHPDRDLLLMVHFMDPHLPYEEGLWYRYRWASFRSPDGYAPARARLYDAKMKPAEQAAWAEHVSDRYDQNIRFVDDELRAVLEAAGPDATTVLFSDHGEELWDHGSFEHGHAFWDEVIHVPLVIRGPHAPPGRYDDPVSILDITPTVLEMAGLDVPDGPGLSLVDRMYRAPGAESVLAERPQAVGRPLYEQDGWAVLDEGHKWIDRAGVRQVYDLGADPGETKDLASEADLAHYPDALAEALEREVRKVWRIRPKTRRAEAGVRIELTHPEGFSEAWMSYDPRGRSAGVTVEIDAEGTLVIAQPPGIEMPNAIFAVPAGDWSRPGGLHLKAHTTGQPILECTSSVTEIPPGPQRNVLLDIGEKGWAFLVDTAHVPERSGVEVSGFHEDVEGQLRELGYLDE